MSAGRKEILASSFSGCNFIFSVVEHFSNGLLGRLLSPILSNYVERLSAMMFVLMRDNEYDSDAFASRTISKDASATGLVRVHAIHIDPFSAEKGIFGGAIPETPPSDVCDLLVNFVSERRYAIEIDRLKSSFRQVTDYTDSHPSLSDRLRAIGVSRSFEDWIELIQQPTNSGLDLLGPERKFALEEVSSKWKLSIFPSWFAIRETQEKNSARISQLETLRKEYKLTEKGYEEYLNLLYDKGAVDQTYETLIDALERYPSNLLFKVIDGWRRLTVDKDRTAIPELLQIAETSSQYAGNALTVLYRYYESQGDRHESEKIRNKLIALEARKEVVTQQMDQLRPSDRIVQAEINPMDRDRIYRSLLTVSNVAEAHAFDKVLTIDGTEHRQSYLLMEVAGKVLKPEPSKVVEEASGKIQSEHDLRLYAVQSLKPWRAVLEGLTDSRIL